MVRQFWENHVILWYEMQPTVMYWFHNQNAVDLTWSLL